MGTLSAKSRALWRLTRMDRPIGIYLLLWPSLLALCVASQGRPTWHHVAVFVIGTVLMRAAGCAINDFADRRIDGLVERTQRRPLVVGDLTSAEAVICFVVLSLLALGFALTLPVAAWPWLIPAALTVFIYPFSKRFINQPQAVLGVAFGFGVPIAFASAQTQIGVLAGLIFMANFCWVVAYDTLYALYDKPDDVRAGIRSMAIWFGDNDLRAVGLLQALHLLLYALAGWKSDLNLVFYFCWLIAALMIVLQMRRLRLRHRHDFLKVFLQNHWIGFVLLVGVMGALWTA